jgi:hypothetical protein
LAALALATNPLPRKLRVGLFADSQRQPRWLVEAFAKVAASDFAEITVIATAGENAPAAPWLWKLYGAVDRRLFGAAMDPGERLDVTQHVPHQRRARLGSPAGLLELNLDVAFALDDLDDSLLDGVARYGVWRFYADGLREVVEGAPLTGSGLKVRLVPGAEPRLAYQSWSCTYPLSIARNRARLLRKTSEFAWRALRELQRSGSGWLDQCRLVRETPDARNANAGLSPISFVPSLAGRMLRRGVEKALQVERWFLAFRFRQTHGGDARAIPGDLSGYTRILPPRDRIWADPFPIERNGRYFVFFEEMPLASGKGHIAMLEIERGGRWKPPVRVLERDYHLSYPFLLEHAGELYMIPETAENRTVELWRCVDFPLRWKLEKPLLEGVRLVDATFLRRNERWWMFANAAPPGWSLNDELHLYHADDLLGTWQPHLRNPVKSDVRCARPAGNLYWRNGALYRPAQICAPDYGTGLSINRVLRLTPHDYAERQVERVLPAAREGLLGIHTVNRAGELTVIDAWSRRSRLT